MSWRPLTSRPRDGCSPTNFAVSSRRLERQVDPTRPLALGLLVIERMCLREGGVLGVVAGNAARDEQRLLCDHIRRIVREKMHPFHQRIGGDDQILPHWRRDDCRIVRELVRSGGDNGGAGQP